MLPLLAAVVAGDIFASEDQHGTWKTILTRSVSRSQIFWAKTLTALACDLLLLTAFAASTIITSLLIVGHQPLAGLYRTAIASGHALRLVVPAGPRASHRCSGSPRSPAAAVRTRNPAFGIAAPVVIGFGPMQLSAASAAST